MSIPTTRRLIQVINLGTQKYARALDIQQKCATKLLDGLAGRSKERGSNVLLLVEHSPVYTIGIRTSGYGDEEEAKLRSLGADFCRTNRGGLITFHGPGQLVAYPVINLKDFGLGMKAYIESVERTVIQTCAHFGLQGKTSGDTGVWVAGKKIAAIGVHGSRYVTTHGTALNCDIDLKWFDHIVPCGLPGKEVTSLTSELGSKVTVQEVIDPFLTSFKEIFNCDLQDSSLMDTLGCKVHGQMN